MAIKKSPVYNFFKRLIDIIGGTIGFFIFAVLYLPIGLAIKLDSTGPILIKAKRLSAGRVIELYKFRSMVADADQQKAALQHLNERDGPFFKMRHDPRITRIGRVIRRFRLDEFPQFINVLKNEMSLVGPRPCEPAEIEQYPAEYKHLADLKAGITGLAQVSGSSALSYKKTLELDEYYNQNRSLWLDTKVMAKTVAIILFDPTAV